MKLLALKIRQRIDFNCSSCGIENGEKLNIEIEIDD